MTDIVRQSAKLTALIINNPRISIRRIRAELGTSKTTTYRWLQRISLELPIKIDKGVVTLTRDDK